MFNIPNLLTASNLLCGCLAIIFTFDNEIALACYLVLLAGVFDFFDGFAARALKVDGELGKQLDSLADMVTFGVVPGIMIFRVLESQLNMITFGNGAYDWVKYIALLIPVLSGFRLAKFNIDTRQSHGFIGLPTPANALFFIAAAYTLEYNDASVIGNVINNPTTLIALVLFFSYLLVAEVSIMAFKFKNYSWQDNKTKYIVLIVAAASIATMQFAGLLIAVLVYIGVSLLGTKGKRIKS